MSLMCSVCSNKKEKESLLTLSCECKACTDCVSPWITSKIAEKQFTIDSKTTCIKAKCIYDTSLQEIYQKLPLSSQQKMDEALLQAYISKQKDIRKCPNSSCSYAGIIDMKQTCSSPFQCDVCGTKWREKEQYTSLENLQGWFIQKSQGFSQAFAKPKSKQCPSCKTKIQKNGSSDHMTCKKCNYEFCYICLNESPLHSQLTHYYHDHFVLFMAILVIFIAFILNLSRLGEIASGIIWFVQNIPTMVETIFGWVINLIWYIVSEGFPELVLRIILPFVEVLLGALLP